MPLNKKKAPQQKICSRKISDFSFDQKMRVPQQKLSAPEQKKRPSTPAEGARKTFGGSAPKAQ